MQYWRLQPQDKCDSTLYDQPTQELISDSHQLNQTIHECILEADQDVHMTQEFMSDSILKSEHLILNSIIYTHRKIHLIPNSTTNLHHKSYQPLSRITKNSHKLHRILKMIWKKYQKEDHASGNFETLLNHNDFCGDGKHVLKISPGEQSYLVSCFSLNMINVSYSTEFKAHIRNADWRIPTSTPYIFKLNKLQTEQVKK